MRVLFYYIDYNIPKSKYHHQINTTTVEDFEVIQLPHHSCFNKSTTLGCTLHFKLNKEVPLQFVL